MICQLEEGCLSCKVRQLQPSTYCNWRRITSPESSASVEVDRPLRLSLHWPPIKQCVTYNMASLTFKVLSVSTPVDPTASWSTLLSACQLLSLCDHLTRCCCLLHERKLNSLGEHSQLLFLTSGTHDCLTLDLVVLYAPIDDISKFTSSDSLKPVAASAKALYTYCIIIIPLLLDSLWGIFGGVHAFGYNSVESEPIWIKSGSLWVHCWGLALTDFGRNQKILGVRTEKT